MYSFNTYYPMSNIPYKDCFEYLENHQNLDIIPPLKSVGYDKTPKNHKIPHKKVLRMHDYLHRRPNYQLNIETDIYHLSEIKDPVLQKTSNKIDFDKFLDNSFVDHGNIRYNEFNKIYKSFERKKNFRK